GETVNALNWDMSHAGAAGAIYSTVEDLHRWNEGIFKGQVLSQESLTAAFTGAKPNISSGLADYGYGWGIGELGGLKLIHHSGGLDGFHSYLARFPQQDMTIAVLHNARPGFRGLDSIQIAHRIARVYLKQDMSTPGKSSKKIRLVDNMVNPKSYLAFEGRYYYGLLKVLEVTTKNNRLFVQLTGQKKFEIFPESPTKFFLDVVDAQVEFLHNKNGDVVAVQHTQNGRSFRAPKLEETAVVEVAADTLDNYAGAYEFDNIGSFTVTRKSDYLVLQVPPKFRLPQDRLDVYGKSETIFFSPLIRKIEIEFIKNGEDKVEKAIIHQGKSKFPGVRIE
ncbi:MAG: serine hydrolase, partial [Gammaproteobacteria bacterium]|nr:serine hydrolase [Gammaproteobacteria bacterium]